MRRAYPELLDQPNRIAQVVTEPILAEIPDERSKEIKDAIKKNEESQLLLEVNENGWSDNKEHLPPIIKPYFSIHDTLSQENGIIVKGKASSLNLFDQKSNLNSIQLTLVLIACYEELATPFSGAECQTN
ncbi:unnamed protein product [Clavelina lepadiformis]|uniref:Uncharacterized protein n=1 Tax=Clavelina lepadiformis TaxID=159417 RepID=A0ABP0GHE4_CLALP